MNMVRMLQETTERYPENPAVIFDGQQITYKDLNRYVEALARHLQELGVVKGNQIAILLGNCPEFVISYFAALRLGAVAVTLNVMSTSYELQHLLEDSEARVLITAEGLAKRFAAVRKELPLCRHLMTTTGLKPGSAFYEIIESDGHPVRPPELGEEDPAVMIYTAGLTGKPMGAVLTYQNLATQAELLRTICGGTAADRALAAIPFFHSFGASVNMLSPLAVGASVVLMDRFTVEGLLAAIQKERVTYITGVPRLFMAMLFSEKRKDYDLSSLRFGITGGAATPPELFAEYEKHFGIPVLEGYGLTETSPCCIFSHPDRVQKPGSIGTVLPGVEAKIVDDAGREAAAGVTGELLIRGRVVMQGYYHEEAATAEVIRDGWLHTGDLAHRDEEGYIFLDGVKKRMIITSGFNVYPKEVELVLDMHPAVAHSRVVGERDLMRGEVVKAIIVKKAGSTADDKEIIQHCRGYLSSYKVPREVVFEDEAA
ncbi:MAG: long-chain fatty acid--CoA ligase [Deltaproteobacteria bacterium]|nr:long-chain fatty acid--CoA ligase [Deltaproteobacteria bacterium]